MEPGSSERDRTNEASLTRNGLGSVLVAQPAKKYAFCGGTGLDKSARSGICGPCNGGGWAHWLNPRI